MGGIYYSLIVTSVTTSIVLWSSKSRKVYISLKICFLCSVFVYCWVRFGHYSQELWDSKFLIGQDSKFVTKFMFWVSFLELRKVIQSLMFGTFAVFRFLAFSFDVFCCFIDKDECDVGPTNCHINAHCVNFPGTYSCTCKEGFFGDGVEDCRGQLIKSLTN